MQKNVIKKISIDGEFVTPHDAELTPWNSDAFFICNELATALAAG